MSPVAVDFRVELINICDLGRRCELSRTHGRRALRALERLPCVRSPTDTYAGHLLAGVVSSIVLWCATKPSIYNSFGCALNLHHVCLEGAHRYGGLFCLIKSGGNTTYDGFYYLAPR